MELRFKPRCKELRSLEGWYKGYAMSRPVSFKLSCRFKDILRCSYFPKGKPEHFYSCYHPSNGMNRNIPLGALVLRDDIAIIYVPDRHGNFLWRCFVRWERGSWWNPFKFRGLLLYTEYGNNFSRHSVKRILEREGIACRLDSGDITNIVSTST